MVLNWIQYSQVENRSDERVPCPGKGREGGREGRDTATATRERDTERPWSQSATSTKSAGRGQGEDWQKAFWVGFLWFFFGLKFHDLQMAPLGLGGGGAPRAWPRCHHGCARPWLRGQASSPWICIHGSVSYPNYCPESCMGAGWDGPALPCVPGTPPGSVRFHGERGGTGRGQGAAAAHNIPSFLWKF